MSELTDLIDQIKANSINKVDLGGDPYDEDFKGIGAEGCSSLAEALKVNTTITFINLCGNKIGDEGCLSLAMALETCTSITSIDVAMNRIGDDGCLSLAKALETNSTITNMNLENNIIGDEGCSSLFKALDTNVALSTINLGQNSIGDEGCLSFAKSLKTNTTITAIHLNGNSIGAKGCSWLADALRTNATINTINLHYNSIGDEGISSLARACEANTSVTTLNLFMNRIGDKGCSSLAKVLETNTTITSIDLHNNIIGNEGCSSLAKALETNTSITSVDLSGNSIGDIGSSLLAKALIVNQTLDVRKSKLPYFNTEKCLKLLELGDEFMNKSDQDIIDYLREKSRGSKIVFRARLLLVGSGYAGKTTLEKRLKDNTFAENFRNMTDGIAMSELTVDEIVFTVYDFAGQEEYMHTHKLFFKDSSVFMVVYRPDSTEEQQRDFDVFLEMVYDCAPHAQIILVTTFADGDSSKGQRPLSDIEIQAIRDRNSHSNIAKIIAVDSRTGSGFSDLKKAMREVALQLPRIRNDIPDSFSDLQSLLQCFTNKKLPIFSITAEEFYTLATKQVKMTDALASLAYDLFCDWGVVHPLSNGDLVLQPQQLADILACVFTKADSKLAHFDVDLSEGLLKHNDMIGREIWGRYDERLWSFSASSGREPPFIRLLYSSGLAFKLRDENGKWLPVSMIPALLPEIPVGFDRTKPVSEETLKEYFFASNIILQDKVHSTIKLTFKPTIAVPFLPQLQVRLRYTAAHNGSWKYGCLVQIPGQKDSEISYAVVFQSNIYDTITIMSAGDSMRARVVVLEELVRLKSSQFIGMEWDTLEYNGVTWNNNMIVDNIKANGFLRLTSGNIALSKKGVLSKKDTYKEDEVRNDATLGDSMDKEVVNTPIVDTTLTSSHLDPNIISNAHDDIKTTDLLTPYEELRRLYDYVRNYDYDDESAETDVRTTDLQLKDQKADAMGAKIRLQRLFSSSISEVFTVIGLCKETNEDYKRKGRGEKKQANKIKAIWLPALDDEQQLVLVPISPDINPLIKPSWTIISECKISLLEDTKDDSHSEIIKIVFNTISKVLEILEVNLETDWKWAPMKKVAKKMYDKVHKVDSRNFILFPGLDNDDIRYSIYKEYSDVFREQKLAPTPVQNDSAIVKLLEQNQKLHQEIETLRADMSTIKTGVKTVIDDVKNISDNVKVVITLSEDIKHALDSLQTYFFKSENQRVVPTTYIILDSSAVLQSKSDTSTPSTTDDSDSNSSSSKKRRLDMMMKGLERMSSIMDSMSTFVSDPTTITRQAIEDRLHDSLHMYLLCECCREPQDGIDGGRWPLIIQRPKERITSILALAKAGLTIARGVNCGLAIGKCFGLPLPSVDDSNFTGAKEYLDKMSVATLDDYKKLQTTIAQYWNTSSSTATTTNSTTTNGSAGDGSKGIVSADGDGFSIAEFERFIHSDDGDPNDEWKQFLYPKIDKSNGNKLYVCQQCISKDLWY